MPTPVVTPSPTPTPTGDPLWVPGTVYLQRFANGIGPFAYDGQWGEQGLVYTSCRNGNGGSHHNASQSAAMTSIQVDGLHLRVQRYNGNEFYSAIISTNAAGLTFQGGVFEAKIKYPAGTGFWPAFWLLKNGTGPRDELDAMEAYPNPNQWPYPIRYELNTHLLVNGTDNRNNLVVNAGYDLTQAFHVFGMEWRQGLIIGYLDGVEVARATSSIPWGSPMYLLLDFKVGSFHTCADSTTPNGDMIVEWVRVRQ